MRSLFDRNVVMRRMTVFSRTSDLIVAVRWYRGLVRAVVLFDPRPRNVGFVVDKVALRQIFLPVLPFPPISAIHTNAPHSSSSTGCSYQKDKRAKPGNLQRAVLFVMSRCH